MTYKKKLMIGLVVTALITVLILNELLPPFIAATIILLAGLGFSYLLVADEIKEEKIKQMSIIIKAVESLNLSTHQQESLELLAMWAKGLVACDEHYLWIKDKGEPEKFKEVIQQHNLKKPQLIEDTRVTGEFKKILYIPVAINDALLGALILADKDGIKLKPYHTQLIEPLVQAVSINIKHMLTQEQETALLKELLVTAIKASEGYNEAMEGHSLRVAKISLLIGQRLGLSAQELKDLEYGALLHDIGQSSVIYQGLKSDSEGERIDYTYHPKLGVKLFPKAEGLEEMKRAILYHHEHYDGTGYPQGLKYTDIPLLARIIAVADTYDAVTHLADEEDRLGHNQALKFIKKGLGSWYDPLVVVAFEEVEKEVQALFL